MRTFLGVITLIITGTGAVFAQVPQKSLPLLDCDGLPCVEVTVAGKTAKLGIDFGDETSVINEKVAAALGLPMKADDSGKYKVATLKNPDLGGVRLPDQQAVALDMTKWIDNGVMPHVDGTLAYTVFDGRLVTLDWPRHRLLISEPLDSAASCPGKCGDLARITFGHKGPHILVATTGFEVNGKPVSAQVDSMYSGTMLIYPTSVEKLGLTEAAGTERKRFFAYTDGGVDMLEAKANSEGFESADLAKNVNLYFAGPKVHLPDGLFDATVGVELLNTNAWSFDFKGMKIWRN